MWLPLAPRMLWVCAAMRAAAWLWAARAVPCCSAAPGLRALGRFADAGWQDLRAVCSQTAVCGAFRIHGAHILPKSARFGCMARRSCQEAPLFSSEAPFGIHGVKKLPRIAAWERIRAQSCHRQAPGNAFHGHFAISERPQRHSAAMPCTVRGAFVAAGKVSCGLRVSMR